MSKQDKSGQIQYRLKRAKDTLTEVDLYIENKHWNTAVNRLYYACYYAVSALLIQNQVETASHAGVRQKFGQLFVLPGLVSRDLGRHFSELFEKRHKGDYDDFFDIDEETALRMVEPSKILIKIIENLLKDSNNSG